jgi:broad specificity phosphatase PhoE
MDYFESIDDDTLIITHRGVINMFYYIFNDINLDMDKKKFDVTHGSIHEIDLKNKKIRRIK